MDARKARYRATGPKPAQVVRRGRRPRCEGQRYQVVLDSQGYMKTKTNIGPDVLTSGSDGFPLPTSGVQGPC